MISAMEAVENLKRIFFEYRERIGYNPTPSLRPENIYLPEPPKGKAIAILTTEESLSSAAIDNISRSWKRATEGTEYAGRIIIMESGMDLKILGAPEPPILGICAECGAPGQKRICQYCGTERG